MSALRDFYKQRSVSFLRSTRTARDSSFNESTVELQEIKIEKAPSTNGNRAQIKTSQMGNKCDITKSGRRKKPRLVGRHGALKVAAENVPRKSGLYLSDIFTTMVDLKWRWVNLIFSSAYILSWTLFALFWYAIVKIRGENVCVDNMYDFTTAFLYSLETQTTIGYGGRQITDKCIEAVLLLIVQSIIGFVISAMMLGLIFAKLSRPTSRAETILFSKRATVSLRDGKMCLMFRLGDVRKSQILEPKVRVQLFRTRFTREGYVLPFYQQDLRVGIDWSEQGREDSSTLYLILPVTILHMIDEDSPFYELSPEELCRSDFELVAILEGTVEATGMLTQKKSSYLGEEVLWGYDFEQCIDRRQWRNGKYRINYAEFDTMYPVNIPLISPKEYYANIRENKGVYIPSRTEKLRPDGVITCKHGSFCGSMAESNLSLGSADLPPSTTQLNTRYVNGTIPGSIPRLDQSDQQCLPEIIIESCGSEERPSESTFSGNDLTYAENMLYIQPDLASIPPHPTDISDGISLDGTVVRNRSVYV